MEEGKLKVVVVTCNSMEGEVRVMVEVVMEVAVREVEGMEMVVVGICNNMEEEVMEMVVEEIYNSREEEVMEMVEVVREGEVKEVVGMEMVVEEIYSNREEEVREMVEVVMEGEVKEVVVEEIYSNREEEVMEGEVKGVVGMEMVVEEIYSNREEVMEGEVKVVVGMEMVVEEIYSSRVEAMETEVAEKGMVEVGICSSMKGEVMAEVENGNRMVEVGMKVEVVCEIREVAQSPKPQPCWLSSKMPWHKIG
ncbi:PREDICTED: gelsolin-related protein of 125 kDa-like isoform X1 [Nelumbo nucifera]|uniref:Gelsolin-related protein of 125 kDa-like isoform X1 n=1 Tax=Nelumbo nucifera TaxID=4432 RepID=A0A1U7ZSM7_NELNU|nr:PREDICTED: gelsolin-related protein of 125 kDa-like isoform X1 [Nelumbo nucifera]